jgi:hypothetical protein
MNGLGSGCFPCRRCRLICMTIVMNRCMYSNQKGFRVSTFLIKHYSSPRLAVTGNIAARGSTGAGGYKSKRWRSLQDSQSCGSPHFPRGTKGGPGRIAGRFSDARLRLGLCMGRTDVRAQRRTQGLVSEWPCRALWSGKPQPTGDAGNAPGSAGCGASGVVDHEETDGLRCGRNSRTLEE